MNFDLILEEIGGSGRAQFMIGLASFTSQLLLCATTYLQIFMQGDDNYRCGVELCENATSAEYENDWLPTAIPYIHEEKSGKTVLDNCHTYKYVTTSDTANCSSSDFDMNTTVPCTSFVYGSKHRTLIKEWQLTCNQKYSLTIGMSVFMAGFLVGVYTFGYIADRFGRRKSILLAVVLNVTCNIAVIFSVNFYMYVTLRFFIAASGLGVMTSLYVLLSEIIGTKHRHLLGVAGAGWQFGEFVLLALAYLIRDWRHLQAAASASTALMLLLYWVAIESPRWLISQGKYEEARKSIEKLAKWQGRKVPAELLEIPNKDLKVAEPKQQKLTPFHLFKTHVIRKRTLLICVIWMFDSLIGYGISLGAKNMPGDLLVNFSCLAVADALGAFTLVFLIKYIRRMLALSLGMFLVGVVLLSNLAFAPDSSYALAGLAMTGRFLMTMNFNITYVYTAELFPTPLRSSAMGTGSMCSRVGGILAPIVASLVNVWHPLPVMIMGTCGFLGSGILLFLPETFNKPLPSRIEEIEETRNNPGVLKILWKELTVKKKQDAVVLQNITRKTDQ